MTPEDAYEWGEDCRKNGVNKINCNFKIFTTEENRVAWEKGRKGE